MNLLMRVSFPLSRTCWSWKTLGNWHPLKTSTRAWEVWWTKKLLFRRRPSSAHQAGLEAKRCNPWKFRTIWVRVTASPLNIRPRVTCYISGRRKKRKRTSSALRRRIRPTATALQNRKSCSCRISHHSSVQLSRRSRVSSASLMSVRKSWKK